jgi:hypothetical protein
MLWTKKNAYEDLTIKKTAKILRHLLKNCNTTDPEEVKLYVANRQCSDARKENVIEAYDKHIKSNGLQLGQTILSEIRQPARMVVPKLICEIPYAS